MTVVLAYKKVKLANWRVSLVGIQKLYLYIKPHRNASK
jgi:hypothetical protein